MAINAINGVAVDTDSVINGISGVDEVNGLELSGGGGAGFSLLEQISEALGINGGTTSAIDTTGADLIIVATAEYADTGTPTISDSKGNTWTVLTASADAFGNRVRIAYTVPSSVGSGHTFTNTGAGQYSSMAVLAFSGSHASPADQENGSTAGSATTGQPGSITPSVDNSLVVTAIAVGATMSPSVTGYTVAETVQYGDGNNIGLSVAYVIQTTATATNPTWTFGATLNAALKIASFKPA